MALEVWWRRCICDAETIHTEFSPCSTGADWTEVGATVFLRAANDGRGNLVGTGRPCVRSSPSVRADEFPECLPYGWSRLVVRSRILELLFLVIADADDDDARPELRDTVVARIEEFYVNTIIEGSDGVEDVPAVVVKLRVEEAPDILQHHGAWADFADESDGFGEQVAFVGFTKLF